MEKAYRQYVSGWMFDIVRPAARARPAAHGERRPHARRRIPTPCSRTTTGPAASGAIRTSSDAPSAWATTCIEIVGVAAKTFTGTEPGTVIDIFVPTMMHPGVARTGRDLASHPGACCKPGVAVEPLRAKSCTPPQPRLRSRSARRASPGMTKQSHRHVPQPDAAAASRRRTGVSGLQQDYRRALVALGVLVALVLLIACANVANLMTAQAAARAREMALRVSIGAGRWRLVQLVLVESAWLAFLAAAIGGAVRMVVRAVCRQQDQSAGQPGPPRSSCRLARARVRPRADPRRDLALRPAARAARFLRQAGQRSEGRRRLRTRGGA